MDKSLFGVAAFLGVTCIVIICPATILADHLMELGKTIDQTIGAHDPDHTATVLPGTAVSNCTDDECENGILECPPDSILDAIDSVCVCDPSHCFRPVCTLPNKPVLKSPGSSQPGECCDVYECVTPHDPDCQDVVCPSEIPSSCPEDSYRMPGRMSSHECCATTHECQCYPEGTCPKPACGAGLRAVIVREGTGLPGSCCDVFHCLRPNGSCLVGEILYQNGSSWMNDNGANCTCINGIVPCNEQIDDPGGCMSVKGELHRNGDTWEEDNCISCTCDRGRRKCTAFMCTPCKHPVIVPGECCPKCEDGPLTQPSHCQPLENCTLSCANGLTKDENGCYLCQCQQAVSAVCRDSNGRLHSDGAVWLEGCRRCFCQGGVELCSLVVCPSLGNCLKTTYQSPSDCCPRCADEERAENKTAVMPKTALCYGMDGVFRADGDTWMLGPCTKCLCHQGLALCEARRCPPAPCENPVISSGQCCPNCPPGPRLDDDNKSGLSCSPTHAHGSTWKLNLCESCTCDNGKTVCFTQKCEASNCPHPVLAKDQCCTMCIDIKTHNAVCQEGNVTYTNSEKWIAEDCSMCECNNGRRICASSQSCLEPCEHHLRRPKHCCAHCPVSAGGSSSTWLYILIGGVIGSLVGVSGVGIGCWLVRRCNWPHCLHVGGQHCSYSATICPSECNEAFTSFARAKYKVGQKAHDCAEKAKLTTV